MNNYFLSKTKFLLESGESLESFKLVYSVIGNQQAKKTIWVCHALTGDANVSEWWSGLFGAGRVFDPAEYKIICANALGSCYGSTGPGELEEPLNFPNLTVRDLANAYQLLAEHLGILNVDVLIGASLGGQQAIEWAIQRPKFASKLILIASNAVHSPYGIAFNEAQRLALQADITFGLPTGGAAGMKAARAVAMLSYRSYTDFGLKQVDEKREAFKFKASEYLKYQGDKFVQRFNPYSYKVLTHVMDSHDVSRGRETLESVLALIESKTLVVGVNSDLLFPLSEQVFLQKFIPNAELGVIHSPFGHDAFLIEYDQLSALIREFLVNDFQKYKQTILKTLKN